MKLIMAIKRKYLRTVRGCKRLNQIKNDDIGKELETQSVQNKIHEHRQNEINFPQKMTNEKYRNRFFRTSMPRKTSAEVE
jgi:hypothetical protein